MPLSFDWDGTSLLLATGERSIAGRGLASGAGVRIGLGATRDVVMVDGLVEAVPTAVLDPAEADRFAQRTGFDPRETSGSYLFFRVVPSRIQAWREENEPARSGRDARGSLDHDHRLIETSSLDCAAVDPTSTTG